LGVFLHTQLQEREINFPILGEDIGTFVKNSSIVSFPKNSGIFRKDCIIAALLNFTARGMEFA